MGIKCKIHRNSVTSEIEVVEDNLGNNSKLFNSLVNHFKGNKEKALDFWSIIHTEEFKRDALNSNEPNLSELLNFVKYSKFRDSKLSNKELNELRNNILNLPLNSLEELYISLRNTFLSAGVFTIDKARLNNSILYNDLEVQNIIQNPKVQGEVKNMVEKLQVLYLQNDLTKFDTLIESKDSYFLEDIQDTSVTLGIGKFRNINPEVVKNNLASKVAGITDINEFRNELKEIDFPSLLVKVEENPEFLNSLFNKYSQLSILPELNSELQLKDNSLVNILPEVLVIPEGNLSLQNYLNFFNTVDSFTWEDSTQEIKNVMQEVEDFFLDMNVDVIGLTESVDYKSREEVLDLLSDLNDFLGNLLNLQESDISTLASKIDNYFGKEVEITERYDKVKLEDRDNSLFYLDTNKSEVDLFLEDSFLKYRGNIVQKVNKIEDLDTLYETVINLHKSNRFLLPKDALKLDKVGIDNITALKRNLDLYLNNEVNKLEVFDVYPVQELKQFILYKNLFKTQGTDSTNRQLMEVFRNYKGDTAYLNSEFISDFYSEILKEKKNNSVYYRQVLSNFEVTKDGVKLKDIDNNNISKVKLLLKEGKLKSNLREYSLLKGDIKLQQLFDFEVKDTPITKLETIKFLKNFNNVIPIYNKIYEYQGDYVVTNTTEDFINVKGEIFERVSTEGIQSIFKPLNTKGNPSIMQKGGLVKNIKQVSTLIKSGEITEINKKVDECL